MLKLMFGTAAWVLVLGVFTCTDNLNALLLHQTVHFQWVWQPRFSDLLIISDARPADPYWLLIKSGHLMGFFVLEILIRKLTGRAGLAAAAAVSFGAATEILQLYFARDGRLLDMAIDSSGVMLAYCSAKAARFHSLLAHKKEPA